jgi:hypothetical protein
LSAGIYVVARCGADSALRYDLLSLFGASGLAAWFFKTETRVWFRRFGIAVVVAWAALSAATHGRIWGEYVFSPEPPVSAKRVIIDNLEARGIKYGEADYWIAYYVTFLTNERVIMHSNSFSRIREYERQLNEHRDEAIRVSREPCEGGDQVFQGVYFCSMD